MKLKKTHFAVAALIAGSVYALAAMALPGNQMTVDVYTVGGAVVGEKIVFDPCYYGPNDPHPISWGSFTGTRTRVFRACQAASEF